MLMIFYVEVGLVIDIYCSFDAAFVICISIQNTHLGLLNHLLAYLQGLSGKFAGVS